jgi:L-alanine-DL-glutamate epimerase-like enolase superfamily enzyme
MAPVAMQRKTGSAIPAYVGHIEEIKTIRKAAGDDFVLAHDPVQGITYTRRAKWAACWMTSVTRG